MLEFEITASLKLIHITTAQGVGKGARQPVFGPAWLPSKVS